MNSPYQIIERERKGAFELETNHFFDIVDSNSEKVIMSFQKEPCLVKNRPRGDWSNCLCYNVEKVEFSPDKKSILFYVAGKKFPGKIELNVSGQRVDVA